jgi:hypothetical protein
MTIRQDGKLIAIELQNGHIERYTTGKRHGRVAGDFRAQIDLKAHHHPNQIRWHRTGIARLPAGAD